jgi:hypothetical protein
MAQAERVRLQPQWSHQLQVSGLKKRELRSALRRELSSQEFSGADKISLSIVGP